MYLTHMCLRAAGADVEGLPETGFMECLTTMPFGNTYLRPEVSEEGPTVFFDDLYPDRGLRRAMGALGWRCDESRGGNEADALKRLGEALESGPALVGPVDMGLLPYNPGAPRGADHFVALPLAARRSLDASLFLKEAVEPDAAGLMEEEALMFGEAQYLAARDRWPEVPDVVERLAGTEGDLAAVL